MVSAPMEVDSPESPSTQATMSPSTQTMSPLTLSPTILSPTRPRRWRQLTLVRVIDSNLHFGCITGCVDGEPDIPVTISLVQHKRQRLVGGVLPRVGDLVGCYHVCHSVFEPRFLLQADELAAHTLLRSLLPFDICNSYFPVQRPLYCVDA